MSSRISLAFSFVVCALLLVSTAMAQRTFSWGDNTYGQLGRGTCGPPGGRAQVIDVIGAVAVAAGDEHSLAVMPDGTVKAWGRNQAGQLGDGTQTNRCVPVQVSGLSGVVAVAAGSMHSIALKQDGTVWSWGYNELGQLGDSTTTSSLIPVAVSGLAEITAISAGGWHNLALKKDGTVWFWGDGSPTPVQVVGLADVVAVAAGSYHNLTLKSDGTVWSWGVNDQGQLGDNTKTARTVPVLVSGLTNVKAIAAGGGHSLALKTDGTVWGWGHSEYGQVGVGCLSFDPYSSFYPSCVAPIQVAGVASVNSISAGAYHSLAATTDGRLLAWGNNEYGQLQGDSGDLDRHDLPLDVLTGSGITVGAFAGGWKHTLLTEKPFVVVKINSSPAGIAFQIDGLTFNSEQTFQWTPGSTHEISAPSPQSALISSAQWVFWSWSDAGQSTHSIITPGGDTTYTASFVLLSTPIAGPEGPVGPPGPKGEPGATGAMGLAGNQTWNTYIPLMIMPLTAANLTLGNNVRVTRIQAQAQVGPVNCSTNAIVRLSDGTEAGTAKLPITAAASDSGELSVDYSVGSRLRVSVTPPVRCKLPPAAVNVIVQYQAR